MVIKEGWMYTKNSNGENVGINIDCITLLSSPLKEYGKYTFYYHIPIEVIRSLELCPRNPDDVYCTILAVPLERELDKVMNVWQEIKRAEIKKTWKINV